MTDPDARSARAGWQAATTDDLAAAGRQLGRPVRGVAGVAHRCACGWPDVLVTPPRLPDGSPFPTLYYLTCPRATGAVSTLESESVMRGMAQAIAQDADLAAAYRSAHDTYLRDRATLGEHPAIAGISAGGMPDRVKCLHVLVAHALAAGPEVNPLGDQALALLAARGIDPTRSWGGSPEGCLPAGGGPRSTDRPTWRGVAGDVPSSGDVAPDRPLMAGSSAAEDRRSRHPRDEVP